MEKDIGEGYNKQLELAIGILGETILGMVTKVKYLDKLPTLMRG